MTRATPALSRRSRLGPDRTGIVADAPRLSSCRPPATGTAVVSGVPSAWLSTSASSERVQPSAAELSEQKLCAAHAEEHPPSGVTIHALPTSRRPLGVRSRPAGTLPVRPRPRRHHFGLTSRGARTWGRGGPTQHGPIVTTAKMSDSAKRVDGSEPGKLAIRWVQCGTKGHRDRRRGVGNRCHGGSPAYSSALVPRPAGNPHQHLR
jgi:hypothetical protein